MNFNLTALDFQGQVQQYAGLESLSVMNNVDVREFNRIAVDDGQLVLIVGGTEVRRSVELYFVMASFQHNNLTSMRREWYEGKWSKNQEKGKVPDCHSFDGTAPDADSTRPQSNDCKTCIRTTTKNAEGFTDCGYRKSFVVYLLEAQADGSVVLDTNTPYVWNASSISLLKEFDATTNSGGVTRILPLLRKSGATVLEGVVFSMGFYQGSKAPVIRAIGGLPRQQVESVMEAAKSEAVVSLLAPIKKVIPIALAAPTQQQALAAPVQQVQQPVYQQPVQQPVQQQVQQPVYQQPVQQPAPAPVYQQPVQQPVYQQQVQPAAVIPAQVAPVTMVQANMVQAAPAPAPAPLEIASFTAPTPAPAPAPAPASAPAGGVRSAAFGAFSNLIKK